MAGEFNAQEALDALEQRITRLLDRCDRLEKENRSLLVSQEQLVAERANLVAKNEQARSRVEAMISRLKSLEQGA
ncbi:MAG: TIGR02449 family protein [Pseudomonadota bacterium]